MMQSTIRMLRSVKCSNFMASPSSFWWIGRLSAVRGDRVEFVRDDVDWWTCPSFTRFDTACFRNMILDFIAVLAIRLSTLRRDELTVSSSFDADSAARGVGL